MDLDFDQIERAFGELRKSLKRPEGELSPEAVHKLRTRTRRVEAIVRAFMPEQPKARRLLKLLKPMRKAAGEVRDMDVFVGDAATLAGNDNDESVVRLIEYFAGERRRLQEKLLEAVEENRREARRLLKRFAGRIAEDAVAPAINGTGGPLLASGAREMRLRADMKEWPRLNQGNLHGYRLKVKELRYLLEVGGDGHRQTVELLGDVKDAIGEWHDWQKMASTATKVLGRDEAATRIRQEARARLGRALSLANAMREKDGDASDAAGDGSGADPATAEDAVEGVSDRDGGV